MRNIISKSLLLLLSIITAVGIAGMPAAVSAAVYPEDNICSENNGGPHEFNGISIILNSDGEPAAVYAVCSLCNARTECDGWYEDNFSYTESTDTSAGRLSFTVHGCLNICDDNGDTVYTEVGTVRQSIMTEKASVYKYADSDTVVRSDESSAEDSENDIEGTELLYSEDVLPDNFTNVKSISCIIFCTVAIAAVLAGTAVYSIIKKFQSK